MWTCALALNLACGLWAPLSSLRQLGYSPWFSYQRQWPWRVRPRRNLDHIVPNWLFLRAIRVRLPASVLSPLTDIRQHVFTVHPTAKAIVLNWRYYVCRDSSIVDIWLFSNQRLCHLRFYPNALDAELSLNLYILIVNTSNLRKELVRRRHTDAINIAKKGARN